MMRHTLRAEYLRSSSYEAALLRYRDSALSLGIILPAGPLEYLLSRASSSGVHELLSDAIPCELTIAMPRFRIESSLELADVLARLGIRSAFDPSADFSGISSREPLKVSFMVHSTYVEVDEEGTEATAAVTSVFTPIARRTAEMTVNRPFLFAIVDMESGTTYFLGQVPCP
jgi:serpin B